MFFFYSIDKFVFKFKSLSDSSGKRSAIFHISEEPGYNAHEQQKLHLYGTTHEQTIICRQLFTGQMEGFRLMKRQRDALNDNTNSALKFFFTIGQ